MHAASLSSLAAQLHAHFHGITKAESDAAVSTCTDCAQAKPVRGGEHVHPIVSKSYGERVVIDLKDFHAYVTGQDDAMRYLMVLIDHYSSWVVVYFLKDKTAETIWSKVLDYMGREGTPQIFHTDNGGEFQLYDAFLVSYDQSCDHLVCSRIADKANSYGYKTARGAPRHPQSQGKVERWNRTISERLGAKHVELGSPKPFWWWHYAQEVVSSYNFGKVDNSNASPYQVARPFAYSRSIFAHGLLQLKTGGAGSHRPPIDLSIALSLSAAAPSDATDIASGPNAEEMSPPQLAAAAFRARVIKLQALHRDKVCLSVSLYDLPFSKNPSHAFQELWSPCRFHFLTLFC